MRLLSSVVGNTLQVPLHGIVHELEVRGLVVHPSGPSTADSTYMQQ